MAVDKLATYQAKRDFTQTREPSGAAAVQPSGKLRFVIRRHAATRLHFDGCGLVRKIPDKAGRLPASHRPGEIAYGLLVRRHRIQVAYVAGTVASPPCGLRPQPGKVRRNRE